jgi:hypothetical protein
VEDTWRKQTKLLGHYLGGCDAATLRTPQPRRFTGKASNKPEDLMLLHITSSNPDAEGLQLSQIGDSVLTIAQSLLRLCCSRIIVAGDLDIGVVDGSQTIGCMGWLSSRAGTLL